MCASVLSSCIVVLAFLELYYLEYVRLCYDSLLKLDYCFFSNCHFVYSDDDDGDDD